MGSGRRRWPGRRTAGARRPQHAGVRGVVVPGAARRGRDDGEPLVRPLARLAGRATRRTSRRAGAGYGRDFRSTATSTRPSTGPTGPVPTAHLLVSRPATEPVAGLRLRRPRATAGPPGRAQRDGGFLAAGSGNDEFALGYYVGDDLPFTPQLAALHACSTATTRRCSARRTRTASTCTRRSRAATRPTRSPGPRAASPGRRSGTLSRPSVPARYYYTDLPFLALWGSRTAPLVSPIDDYFHATARRARCRTSSFVDPEFVGPDAARRPPARRHPRRAALRPRRVQGVRRVAALGARRCSSSPTTSGAASSTTCRRRRSPDDRASADRRRRTSARPASGCRRSLASPYVRPGFVDHRHVRPHVDPAVPRVAVPRRAPGGTRAGRATLVPHHPRPQRQQHRRRAW